MVLPGFNDRAINPRARLMVALGISLVFWPLLADELPGLPGSAGILATMLFMELFIGIAFGTMARMFMAALNVAGELIGFQIGFQAAMLFNPQSGSNTTAISILLLLIMGVMIFATDLHHLFIEGVLETYAVFPVGQFLDLGLLAQTGVKVLADAFVAGVKIAAPVMVTGFLGYAAFGIFNRIVPQMQVFFVALPLTIMIGLAMLTASLSAMLLVFTQELTQMAQVMLN